MESVIEFPLTGAAAQGEEGAHTQALPLCNVQEFAAATGVSEQTIRRYIREGEIPAIRVGRRLLICTDKLLEGSAGNGGR